MQFAQKLVKERRLNGKLKCGLGKVGPGKQEEDARACKWTKVQVEEIDSRKKEKLLDDRKTRLISWPMSGPNLGLRYGGEWATTNAIRDQR